jgi:hypothetical protein
MAMGNTITPSSPTSGDYFFTFIVSHQKGSFSSKCAGLPGPRSAAANVVNTRR